MLKRGERAWSLLSDREETTDTILLKRERTPEGEIGIFPWCGVSV
jgi:hypothetical protein